MYCGDGAAQDRRPPHILGTGCLKEWMTRCIAFDPQPEELGSRIFNGKVETERPVIAHSDRFPTQCAYFLSYGQFEAIAVAAYLPAAPLLRCQPTEQCLNRLE